MKRVTIHLGADNTTGRIDREAVAKTVAENWEGATILYGTGVWRGTTEETAMIILYTEAGRQEVKRFADLLCGQFNQEAVYCLVEDLPT